MNTTPENIHVRSFREFIQRRLPEALGAAIPLTDYKADWTGDGKGGVTFYVGENGPRITFDDLPFPRPDGSFVAGSGRCVVMSANSNDLEQAEIKAVGEQLMEELAPRLVAPPNGGEWDEATLRAWFPLDTWLKEILLEGAIETSQWLDVTNPIARATHLRRITITGDDCSFHPSQIGRVDPLETPEGPNTGRIFTLARGAEVRDGRIVPAPDRAEGTLGLSSSLVPLLCHNDPTQQLMGSNMIRQALVQEDPEPPLVPSGLEPEDGRSFLGRNLLTAYLHWKGMTYEDAIVVSESAAKRLASAPWVAEVGDKLANRHGAKGVVGAVLPDDEMPHLPDGRAVELIFDAMGVYSRLNFGQLVEATLGLVAHARGEPVVAPPFQRTTPAELHAQLREAGLPESGQFVLRDGKDGAELDEPTTVGYVYWSRLVHEARSKIHAFAPNWQERAGYRRGQRAGRLEYLALRSVGASENILDAFCTRARPAEESDWYVQRVGRGFIEEGAAPPSPAFQRVQRALRAGGVAMDFTGEAVQFGRMAGDGLLLNETIQHPWLPGAPLTRVGRPDDHAELYEQVVAANDRVTEARRGSAMMAAQAGLQRAVDDLLEALRGECVVDFVSQAQFTGRSTLAPGCDLQLGQVGLPEDIAWPLFAPLIADQIGWQWVQDRFDRAKRLIEQLMRESVVIINRAPTWEPTSITAFTPVLVPGRSLLLHPLCCRLFNADFDGDQAAVWLPLTKAAQAEAKEKLTILGHLRRDPTVVVGHLTPAQGILMGLAYALEFPDGREELAALWPAGCDAPAAPLTRGGLVTHLLAARERIGPEALLDLLERLYRMGISWATRSGASFSPFVGEAVRLPAPPASAYAQSWLEYASAAEAAISAQGASDPTLRAPLRAIRSEARGSVAHLRAVIGPWGVESPSSRRHWEARPTAARSHLDTGGPIVHGLRDGLEAEELWVLAERSRRRFQEIYQAQYELAASLRLPSEASVLRRAMVATDPAAVFAEAAEKGETDPLTDPDVRLWVGLRP